MLPFRQFMSSQHLRKKQKNPYPRIYVVQLCFSAQSRPFAQRQHNARIAFARATHTNTHTIVCCRGLVVLAAHKLNPRHSSSTRTELTTRIVRFYRTVVVLVVGATIAVPVAILFACAACQRQACAHVQTQNHVTDYSVRPLANQLAVPLIIPNTFSNYYSIRDIERRRVADAIVHQITKTPSPA